MAEEKKEEAKKVRRPQALKRDIQSLKRNLANRAFKSRVNSAIRTFEGSASQGNAEAQKKQLNTIFSLVDKGVKTGIFKLNKASRIKSKLAQRTQA